MNCLESDVIGNGTFSCSLANTRESPFDRVVCAGDLARLRLAHISSRRFRSSMPLCAGMTEAGQKGHLGFA